MQLRPGDIEYSSYDDDKVETTNLSGTASGSVSTTKSADGSIAVKGVKTLVVKQTASDGTTTSKTHTGMDGGSTYTVSTSTGSISIQSGTSSGGTAPSTSTLPAVGKTYTVNSLKYKVTKSSSSSKTVTVTGSTSKAITTLKTYREL